ncbi:MAG: DNA alkylation repair enzyme, partial [Alistipes sp.]|nr:DNA alkylation repair enzyme [Alistipes sp.]
AYAALLGAARWPQLTEKQLPPTLALLRKLPERTPQDGTSRLLAQGAVVLLDALGRQNETNRQAVLHAVGPLARSAGAEGRFVCEELGWRLA